MQYGSCLTYFLNQDTSTTLEYCRSDWVRALFLPPFPSLSAGLTRVTASQSSLVTWLSSDCNAANSAHGGLCVAQDQRWYVQVQNTSG